MPEQPLVSVIMNCFNGEKYLREALESVLAQTYSNWELIFWDNQSTDQSAELFKSYDDSRFKYYYASKHTLLYEARNYAVSRSHGEFIAFLDVDDWWDSEKLEKQIPLFNDPEVGLVYGNYWFENERKGTRKVRRCKQLPSGRILNELLNQYVVGLLTIVVRRQAFEGLGRPFDPQYHVIGDFDLTVRLAITWKLACVQEPIAHCRWHGANESSVHNERHIQELETWYGEMLSHPVLSQQSGLRRQADLILYLKAMKYIYNSQIIDALRVCLKLPFCVEKIKLMIAIVLPNRVLSGLRA